MQKSKYLTLVAVGDDDSNKTELLWKYTGGPDHSQRYDNFIVPKFQTSVHNIIVDRIRSSVRFVDIECGDDYIALRREAYEKADCVLLCYSIRNKSTFRSIYKKWCLEVRRHAPSTPVILVATDIASRNSANVPTVSSQQGENLKLLIGASAFVECSIEHFLGIDDVFIEAVRSTHQRKYYHHSCHN